MKTDEIREMNMNELVLEEDDLREQYFNLRFQKLMNRLENTSQLSKIKKNIARVKTIIREKELQIKTIGDQPNS
ncbi:MAG: 50S ribosomal protein L29 [Candidatus Cloacimonadota bacterium]|nr:50S ribosomal protein L29 [Candidatus Cloacimonadota bacterium]